MFDLSSEDPQIGPSVMPEDIQPNPPKRPLHGILGGMGPIVSAHFIQEIYRNTWVEKEQELPRIVLLSDPSVPDRTDTYNNAQNDLLARVLAQSLSALLSVGADDIIITCFSAHIVMDLIPAQLRNRVQSLIDTTLDLVEAHHGEFLLLSTEASRKAGLFTENCKWEEISHRVRFPSWEDQDEVQTIIYELKSGCDPQRYIERIDNLMRFYKVTGFIVGCTEFHLVSPYYSSNPEFDCIDALTHIVDDIREW